MKQKVSQEVMDLIQKKVAEKVETDRQIQETELLIIERGNLICELENILADTKSQSRKGAKSEIEQLKNQMSDTNEEIAFLKKENVEIQKESKDATIKIYELSKEADDLRVSLMKFAKVKESLNSCIPQDASASQTPQKKSPEKLPVAKSALGSIANTKKNSVNPVKMDDKRNFSQKKSVSKQQEILPDDDDFWLGKQ